MPNDRRRFLMGAGFACLAVGTPGRGLTAAAGSRVFRPETFGAKGDGVTNDSRAFEALGKAVTAAGGGTIELRRTTYCVGLQTPGSGPDDPSSFHAVPLLEVSKCHLPVAIAGNGARLKCSKGLRYGIFDPVTGRASKHPMPYVGSGGATPYWAMIRIMDCTGPVTVRDLELDGSSQSLIIGGQYGDTGWQIPAIGLALMNNAGPELVQNLYTHHHAFDGLYIDGLDPASAPQASRRIVGVRAEYNGRQGCSVVGGRGYSFENCTFAHTGRAGIVSMPGAGLDLEAEGGKTIRQISFANCRFTDNAGCGMVADTGDTADVRFAGCTFIGTTNWSAWPNKPFMKFQSCTFAGALCRAWGDPNPARAAHFIGCTFTDDPRLSPTGRLYGGENPDRPLADLSDAKNMLFQRCRFLATHSATLPWSYGAIFQDCQMQQSSPKAAFPRGKYLGTTTINGRVDLAGSTVVGAVVINGERRAAMQF
jgi:Right handed beta helix region